MVIYFLQCFAIMALSSYLHLKTTPLRNWNQNKVQKTIAFFKKEAKMLQTSENSNAITWTFYFLFFLECFESLAPSSYRHL